MPLDLSLGSLTQGDWQAIGLGTRWWGMAWEESGMTWDKARVGLGMKFSQPLTSSRKAHRA
jgi:hypothetical protein